MKIKIHNATLLFPALDRAKDYNNDGNFKFSAVFRLPLEGKQSAGFMDLAVKTTEAMGFASSAVKDNRLGKYPSDHLQISANSKERNEAEKNPLLITPEGIFHCGERKYQKLFDKYFFQGALVEASCEMREFVSKGEKRLCMYLNGIKSEGKGELITFEAPEITQESLEQGYVSIDEMDAGAFLASEGVESIAAPSEGETAGSDEDGDAAPWN